MSSSTPGVGFSRPGSGGGGGDTYTNSTPTPADFGGIPAGSTFNGETMAQMWDALLYPFATPSFDAFSIQAQAAQIEVGSTLAANRTFLWHALNSTHIKPNIISITDITGPGTIATGLAYTDTPYLSVYPAITKIVPTAYTFRITGQDTQNVFFTRDFVVNWVWKAFFGESANAGPLVEADIEALRVSGLSGTFVGTYAFLGGGYKYIAYPASYGTATVFKDTATNFDVPFDAPYIVPITNSFGHTTNYRVHRTWNSLGGAINIAVS